MHASIFTRVRPPARHSLLSSHLVHALTHVRANRRSPDPPIRARRQTPERPARARSPSIRSLDGGRATRVPHLLFLPIPHAHPQRLRLGERASLTALRASRKNPRRRSRASLVSRVVRVVASSRSHRIDRSCANRPIAHRVAIASSRAPSRRYTDRHASFPSSASSLASRLVVVASSSSRSFGRRVSFPRAWSSRRRRSRPSPRVVASLAVDDPQNRSSRVLLVARLDDATSTSTRARRCVSNASIRVPAPGRVRDASGTGRERRPRAASTSTRRGEARARRFGSYFIGTRV